MPTRQLPNLIGWTYCGNEGGTRLFTGMIGRVEQTEDYIAFFNTKGERCFGIDTKWGSWHEEEESVIVEIPWVGIYRISPPSEH